METYAETGLVRFEYKHFAFIGRESTRAAVASECANDQGQFWQYHDTVFLNQHGENQGAFSDRALRSFAAALGLDEDEFTDCLNSDQHLATIQAELAEGQSLGVQSTPTIVINGQIAEGAQSFPQLQQYIEQILAGN